MWYKDIRSGKRLVRRQTSHRKKASIISKKLNQLLGTLLEAAPISHGGRLHKRKALRASGRKNCKKRGLREYQGKRARLGRGVCNNGRAKRRRQTNLGGKSQCVLKNEKKHRIQHCQNKGNLGGKVFSAFRRHKNQGECRKLSVRLGGVRGKKN